MNPVSDYLGELSRLLRRSRRKRIIAEVQAHLLEAVAADPRHLSDPQLAARLAVDRFGPPARVASQFNAVRRRPLAMVQRLVAVSLACAGMGTLGAATVWALAPGGVHAHAHAAAPRTDRSVPAP